MAGCAISSRRLIGKSRTKGEQPGTAFFRRCLGRLGRDRELHD